MNSRTRVPVLLAALVGVPVLLLGGFLAYLQVSGTPLLDEWTCGDGEAPVLTAEGGSYCEEQGATLPEGDEWDPFGNRPAECHDRWGFTEVQREEQPDTAPAQAAKPDATQAHPETDCVAEGDTVPDGWTPVPAHH